MDLFPALTKKEVPQCQIGVSYCDRLGRGEQRTDLPPYSPKISLQRIEYGEDQMGVRRNITDRVNYAHGRGVSQNGISSSKLEESLFATCDDPLL